MENHFGNMVTNMKSRAPIVLVPAWPAFFLLIGWRVSDHPLPLHLLPVRLGILQHVVVEGRRSARDGGEEVVEEEGLQHWNATHG